MIKKNICVLFILFCDVSFTLACSVCGIGVSNVPFNNITPNQHNISIDYSYNYFINNYKLKNIVKADEYLQNLNTSFKFNIKDKAYITLNIPFNAFKQIPYDPYTPTNITQGLGDISTTFLIPLFKSDAIKLSLSDTNFISISKMLHRIYCGGGVKLPTGKYYKNESGNAAGNTQIATGSLDFIVQLYYLLTYSPWSFSTNVLYKINSSNNDNYYFGNRLNTNCTFAYTKNFSRISLTPALVLAYDFANQNYDNKLLVIKSGLNILKIGIDAHIQYDNWTFKINYSAPLYQNIADDTIEQRYQYGLSLTYAW